MSGAHGRLVLAGVRGRQGQRGVDGRPFRIDAIGPLSDRGEYDDSPSGFTYLATESGMIYFRTDQGAWSEGVQFRGEKGEPGQPAEFSGWAEADAPLVLDGVLVLDLSRPRDFTVVLDQSVSEVQLANFPDGRAPTFNLSFIQNEIGGHGVSLPESFIGNRPEILANPMDTTIITVASLGHASAFYILNSASFEGLPANALRNEQGMVLVGNANEILTMGNE